VELLQETPCRLSLVELGVGPGTTVHVDPFQLSLREPPVSDPTAMQKLLVGQETLWSELKPVGLDGATIDQLVPLKTSANVNVWFVGSVYAPTAIQLLEFGHESERSRT
jgi:hypothetical protein